MPRWHLIDTVNWKRRETRRALKSLLREPLGRLDQLLGDENSASTPKTLGLVLCGHVGAHRHQPKAFPSFLLLSAIMMQHLQPMKDSLVQAPVRVASSYSVSQSCLGGGGMTALTSDIATIGR